MATTTFINESLEEKGWFLSQEGIDSIKEQLEQENPTLEQFIEVAKDTDLREICDKGFRKGDLTKRDQLPSPLVLQVLQVQNIAVPSIQHVEKPRLLRVVFTDGSKKKWIGAEILGPLESLSLHTPPGTKFLVTKPIDIREQLLILGPGMMTSLGGHVQEMVQAWKAGKQFIHRSKQGKQSTSTQDDAPPPFVPFKIKTINKDTTSITKQTKDDNTDRIKEKKMEKNKTTSGKKDKGGKPSTNQDRKNKVSEDSNKQSSRGKKDTTKKDTKKKDITTTKKKDTTTKKDDTVEMTTNNKVTTMDTTPRKELRKDKKGKTNEDTKKTTGRRKEQGSSTKSKDVGSSKKKSPIKDKQKKNEDTPSGISEKKDTPIPTSVKKESKPLSATSKSFVPSSSPQQSSSSPSSTTRKTSNRGRGRGRGGHTRGRGRGRGEQ